MVQVAFGLLHDAACKVFPREMFHWTCEVQKTDMTRSRAHAAEIYTISKVYCDRQLIQNLLENKRIIFIQLN